MILDDQVIRGLYEQEGLNEVVIETRKENLRTFRIGII